MDTKKKLYSNRHLTELQLVCSAEMWRKIVWTCEFLCKTWSPFIVHLSITTGLNAVILLFNLVKGKVKLEQIVVVYSFKSYRTSLRIHFHYYLCHIHIYRSLLFRAPSPTHTHTRGNRLYSTEVVDFQRHIVYILLVIKKLNQYI